MTRIQFWLSTSGASLLEFALFDVVDGRYRFLASGSAPTTAYAPYKDISEGLRLALEQLQSVTGRKLVGPDEKLIAPTAPDGTGVDMIAVTVSAGPPIKVVVMGLLDEVSLESARNLAATTYAKVVDTISLNDRRKTAQQLDAILRIRPDLIVAAGGTDGGASQSVIKLLETAGLAAYLLPEGQRPEILFAGNQLLADEIKDTFERFSPMHIAANVRPSLEVEQLEAAQYQLARLNRRIRSRQVQGVKELDSIAGGGLLPTSAALGRIIRFLSKVYGTNKGVLGVDVGSSATSISAAFDGELINRVFPQLGLGTSLSEYLDITSLESVTRWLHLDIHPDDVRQYIYNKWLYPASLPATPETLAIEQALARQAMRTALQKSMGSFPKNTLRYGEELAPWFEPILAMGSVLTHAPNLAQSALLILDGIQPTGVTTLVLDKNHIAASLGAISAINPLVVVQVLESNTFHTLGTVISPVGDARPGTPILRVRMEYDGGGETSLDVKQGTLELLRLPLGKAAQLHLQPLHRYDIGMGGPGRGGRLRVVGGMLGVIVDGRGRPIQMPDDPARRQEMINKWRWMLEC